MQYDLSLEDVNVCKTKNAKSNQLAFGVMLSFFKRYTQFPMATEANISSELILQVAKSLDIDPLFITTFDWSGRNAKKYRQEIRKYLGYRVTNAEDIASIINYLVDNLISRQLSDSVLLEQTRLYFSKNKIEIVSTQQLEGYILLANQKFEQQFFDKIFNNLNQEDFLLIDRILGIMNKEVINSWGMDEFNNLVLGDKRLTDRLIRVIDSFTNTPESTINQACGSWAETKAAYRFFQNENVKESEILSAHIAKTVERIKNNDTVLVIQDTSYIKYTSHKKTTGLGVLTRRGADRKETKGLVMHTAFVVSLNGLVLGILDQNINARPISSRKLKKSSHNNAAVPIEDKESIKWLSSLKTTVNSTISTGSQVVTVCDREADIYDFLSQS